MEINVPVSPDKVLKGGLIRKAAQLVHAPYGGEIHQIDSKVFHFLLYRVYGQIGRVKMHRIPVSDVMNFLGEKSRIHRVHESLKRLNDADIHVEWEDEDGVAHSLRAHYLSYDIAHSTDGYITFAFDPFAIELLSNPRVFAQLSLAHLKEFKSLYSTKLYEIMALREKREHKVWSPTIDDFRAQMGITSGYDRFDNLLRRVVMPAVDETNEIAPFGVLFDLVRGGQGGRVIGFKFTAVPRDQRTLVDGNPASVRRPTRNPDTPDLFDGRTDSDRRHRPSEIAFQRAAEMYGSMEAALEGYDCWVSEMEGRRIRSPDKSFLNWIDLRMARETGAADTKVDLSDVEPNALAGFLTAWEDGR